MEYITNMDFFFCKTCGKYYLPTYTEWRFVKYDIIIGRNRYHKEEYDKIYCQYHDKVFEDDVQHYESCPEAAKKYIDKY